MELNGLVYLDDHKMLVELACATTLAPLYAPTLASHLFPPTPTSLASQEENEDKAIVFIFCGGFKISNDEMAEYSRIVADDVVKGGSWKVCVDERTFEVRKEDVKP